MSDHEQREEIAKIAEEIRQRIQEQFQDSDLPSMSVDSAPSLLPPEYQPTSIEFIVPRWKWMPVWLCGAPILKTFLTCRYEVEFPKFRLTSIKGNGDE